MCISMTYFRWNIIVNKKKWKQLSTLQLCVYVFMYRLLPIKPLNCFICLVENYAVDADYVHIVTPEHIVHFYISFVLRNWPLICSVHFDWCFYEQRRKKSQPTWLACSLSERVYRVKVSKSRIGIGTGCKLGIGARKREEERGKARAIMLNRDAMFVLHVLVFHKIHWICAWTKKGNQNNRYSCIIRLRCNKATEPLWLGFWCLASAFHFIAVCV